MCDGSLMDGTIQYYIEQVNRKLLLVLDDSISRTSRELIQEILDTDLVELAAIAKQGQRGDTNKDSK